MDGEVNRKTCSDFMGIGLDSMEASEFVTQLDFPFNHSLAS